MSANYVGCLDCDRVTIAMERSGRRFCGACGSSDVRPHAAPSYANVYERILPGDVVHLEPRPTVGSRDEMLGLPPMSPALEELCRRLMGD